MERRDKMVAALFCDSVSNDARFIEILTGYNEFCTKRLHGRILFRRIAFGNNDECWNARLPRRDRHGLSMIAACCRDEARRHPVLAPEHLDIHEASACFE